MKDFWLIILALLIFSLYNFHQVEYIWRHCIRISDFGLLRDKETSIDRFIIWAVDKYTYVRHKRKKKKVLNYIFWSKKIYKYFLLFLIPWLIIVYLKGWYFNRSFVIIHHIVAFIVCNLPYFFLRILVNIAAIRSRRYEKEDGNLKSKQ